MYAEVIAGAIRQTVPDAGPVTTADGTQYPGDWPKGTIPDLVAVTVPAVPDPTRYTVAGTTVALVDGVPTLTYRAEAFTPPPAPTLDKAQAAQINILSAACRTAIAAGFSSPVLGMANTYTLTPLDQTNLLSAYAAAQAALADAKAWEANAAADLYEVVQVGSATYLCLQAGTTGAAAPAWPTAMQQVVADGTAQWALAGWLLGTDAGSQWHTPAQVMAVWRAYLAFVNGRRATYAALAAQVGAATTVASCQAVVWS